MIIIKKNNKTIFFNTNTSTDITIDETVLLICETYQNIIVSFIRYEGSGKIYQLDIKSSQTSNFTLQKTSNNIITLTNKTSVGGNIHIIKC